MPGLNRLGGKFMRRPSRLSSVHGVGGSSPRLPQPFPLRFNPSLFRAPRRRRIRRLRLQFFVLSPAHRGSRPRPPTFTVSVPARILPAILPASPKVSPSRGVPSALRAAPTSACSAESPARCRRPDAARTRDGETLPRRRRSAPAHLTEAGVTVEIPDHRQLEETLMAVEDESYPEPVEFRATPLSDALRGSRDSVSAGEIDKQREHNQKAVQLLKGWIREDAEAESGTWELLKSELDRDRLSGRKLWI